MLFVTFFCFVFLRVLFLLFFCFVLVLLLFFIETDCYFREKRHTYSDASILFPSVSMSAGDDDCSVRPHFSSSRGIWLQIINGRKRPRHHICEANIALWSTELPTHSFVNFISEINYIYIYIYIYIYVSVPLINYKNIPLLLKNIPDTVGSWCLALGKCLGNFELL